MGGSRVVLYTEAWTSLKLGLPRQKNISLHSVGRIYSRLGLVWSGLVWVGQGRAGQERTSCTKPWGKEGQQRSHFTCGGRTLGQQRPL